MKGEDLPDPDSIQTTSSAYLLGLCDVVGELRRGALDFMLEGNTVKAEEYLGYMDRIYDAIMSFDYPSSLVPVKKKQDMVRGLIEKTRGELACTKIVIYYQYSFSCHLTFLFTVCYIERWLLCQLYRARNKYSGYLALYCSMV